MTPRARDLLNRSRAILGTSRDDAASQGQPTVGQTPFGDAAAARTVARPGSPARARTRPGIPAAGAQPHGPVSASTEPCPTPHTAHPGDADHASSGAPSTTALALSAICADIALRDLNLLDLLLAQLEEMEAKEEDADRLAELYRLDHLAARLRRNAENLRVLAGRDTSEGTAASTALVDIVRAAMSSIDQYSRIVIGKVVSLGVTGFAAEDLGRVLSELLDNATRSSPPTTPVRVGVHLTETGSALLRVEDEGIGLPADRRAQLNERLAGEPVLDDNAVRHMGLAVIHRLAIRHGLRIWLDSRQPHGTTASVLIPPGLVCELPEATWSGAQTVQRRPADGTGADSSAEPAGSRPVGAGRAPDGAGPLNGASRMSAFTRPTAPGDSPHTAARPPSTAALFGRLMAPPPATAPDSAVPPSLFSGPPPSSDVLTSGTTATGLPRRVSRSLRSAPDQPAAAEADQPEASQTDTDLPGPNENTENTENTGDAGDAGDAGTSAAPGGDATSTGSATDQPATGADRDAADRSDSQEQAIAEPAAAAAGTAAAGFEAGSGVGSGGLNGHLTRTHSARAESRAADHARLLADLDAFTEGEQTAHKHQRGD